MYMTMLALLVNMVEYGGQHECSSNTHIPRPYCSKLYTVFFREAMGVVLHKDSKWYQQWKDFKDNNMVFNSKE